MNATRIIGLKVGLACLFLTGSALAGTTSTTAINVTCPAGPSFTVPTNTVTRAMGVVRDSTQNFFLRVTLGNNVEFDTGTLPVAGDLTLTTAAGGAVSVSFISGGGDGDNTVDFLWTSRLPLTPSRPSP